MYTLVIRYLLSVSDCSCVSILPVCHTTRVGRWPVIKQSFICCFVTSVTQSYTGKSQHTHTHTHSLSLYLSNMHISSPIRTVADSDVTHPTIQIPQPLRMPLTYTVEPSLSGHLQDTSTNRTPLSVLITTLMKQGHFTIHKILVVFIPCR